MVSGSLLVTSPNIESIFCDLQVSVVFSPETGGYAYCHSVDCRFSLFIKSEISFAVMLKYNCGLLVWIDGPYGLEMDFDKCDQALLIATGIGTAAQMSYVRLLVETSLSGKRCRDILFWLGAGSRNCFTYKPNPKLLY